MKADKMRAQAERMRATAEQKLAPRETNTARKLAMARGAEREGWQLQRAASYLESLADAVESGSLPACLASFKPTKDNLMKVASLKGQHVSNGYHSYLVDTDEFYDNSPEAVALRGLVERRKSEEDKQAEAEKSREIEIRRAIDELRNCSIPGFFPTPPGLVSQIMDALGLRDGMTVLEPSAGLGDLADAASEVVGKDSVTVCEYVPRLCDILRMKGYSQVICGDFLQEFNGSRFDRILMNPPFERGADVEHVRRAAELLAPGGVLVAIMSAGTFFNGDRKRTEFREWLESRSHTVLDVEPGAFADKSAFRQTGTACKIVVIDAVCEPESEPLEMPVPCGRSVQMSLF